jgi:hypothetical protein
VPSKYSSSAPPRGEQPLLPPVRLPTPILAGDDDPIIPVINAQIMRTDDLVADGGSFRLARSVTMPSRTVTMPSRTVTR